MGIVMSEVSGPRVVFGVKSWPDSPAAFGENAVLVAMTARLSVAPLPPLTELFTPTHFVTSKIHHSLQDESDTLWSAVESQFKENSILTHKYEFNILFSNLLMWRWLIRHTIQTLNPRQVLIPTGCTQTIRTVASLDEVWEWTLYQLLEEETRHVARDYFTEVSSRPLTGNKPRSYSLFRHKLVELTVRTINKALKLIQSLRNRSEYSNFLGRVSYRDVAKRINYKRINNQVQNVLVIAQLAKVQSLIAFRSTGVRVSYLSYTQFEGLISPKNGPKPRETILTSELNAQTNALNYFNSSVAHSEIFREPIERLLRGNWSILMTDAGHNPQINSLVDRGIQVGKRVAYVPEGATSYVEEFEKFGGQSVHYHNSRATRFVLDAAMEQYWVRAGTPSSRIHVSGYLGSDRPAAGRRQSVSSLLLDASIRRLPTSKKKVTVTLSFDAFFMFIEIGQFGFPGSSLVLHRLLQILGELLDLGYRVLVKTRDSQVTQYLQCRFKGRSAMFTDSIPWHLLAVRSDIVIARDSSIGWQSLSGGKPVLVWNFEDYSSMIEVTLAGIPDYWVSVVRSVDGLDAEITNLLARHREESLRSGADGRLLPPVFSRPDMIYEWINNPEPPETTCDVSELPP
jgi:hypothetical protein